MEQDNGQCLEQGHVAGREGVAQVLTQVLSALLGLTAMLSLSFGMAALAQVYYNAQHAAAAAAEEGGGNLDMDLLVIFVMCAAIIISIPFGIWVYRWTAKRIPKVIFGH